MFQARRKMEKQNIPTTLTLAKKNQLVQQLLEKQKSDMQKLKQKTDKMIDNLHTLLVSSIFHAAVIQTIHPIVIPIAQCVCVVDGGGGCRCGAIE